jgi:molybdate transport system substrate-binding protein
MPRRIWAAGALALITAAAVAGCAGSSSGAKASGGSSSSTAALSGTITVFAAASLTEAFATLGHQFEAAHPGVKVVLNFGPSSGLATQITQSAPADVFASASQKNMDQVVTAGDASGPTPFVKNVMEVAVPPANPAHITSVNDLARTNVKVALCQSQVPCGATAAKVFTNAKLTVHPVTQEVDVKSVLSKVELDEVDAGVVYVTDVRAAGAKVKGVAIPDAVNASTTYPIATLSHAHNPSVAAAFVDYVLSDAGKAVLSADGFEQP